MNAMWFDIYGVFSHELQDVLDGGGVGEPSQTHAISGVAHGEEGRGGQHRHWNHRRRRERGDQWSGHVAVQHLEDQHKSGFLTGV